MRLNDFKNKSMLFYILLIAQPILDVIAYFQYDNVFGSLAGYSRLFIMCALVIAVFFVTNNKKMYLIIMGIIAFYCCLHMLNGFRVGYESIFEDLSYLAKVVQMPILAVCFIHLVDSDCLYATKKACFTNLFIIAFIVIVSVVTGTDPTTYVDDKVGYLGWFGNSNTQSIIIVGLAPLALAYAIKKEKLILLILGVATMTFLLVTNGTKGCYYSLYLLCGACCVFLVFEAILHKKINVFKCMAIVVLLLSVVAAYLYYPSSARNYLDTREVSVSGEWNKKVDDEVNALKGGEELDFSDPNVIDKLLLIYEKDMNKGLVKKWGAEKVLREYGLTPVASTLADNRLAKRMYAKFVWEESDFITKLVGFEFAKIDDYDLENDFPAIFYYYGYVGFGLYVVFLLYFVYRLLKKVILDFKGAMTFDNFALLMSFALLLGLAQYSGALLRRPNASIYLSVVLALVYFATKTTKKKSL